ncbi:Alpha-adducin [Cichlidogyrus casuarinus]|uniref:Alpha-adducin n=1 Tax=Cichlidogyrus casuarinus TaxID=1844966 RepID=A0ABD2Q514_9PLAT
MAEVTSNLKNLLNFNFFQEATLQSPTSKNNTFNSSTMLDVSRFSNTSAFDKITTLLSNNLRLDQIGDLKGNIPTIPINDLRGNEAALFTREERLLRCRLASLYRLLDLYGWTQSIYNHISVRCSKDHFLINPFGLLYHEVQASSLVKIDGNGNVVDPGTTVLGINKAGWTLHSALHAYRPEVDCIVHVHLPDVIAVSCLKVGLLPLCPEASELLNVHGVRYHDYQGILVDEKERQSIQHDLGTEDKIMFLRNHGVVIAARSVAEAWYLLKRVIAACQVQVRLLQQGGSAYLSQVADKVKKVAQNGHSNGHTANGDAPAKKPKRPFENDAENGLDAASLKSDDLPEWTPVEKEFEAQMRILDSAGFSTGHQYRQPNLLRRGHYGPLADGYTTMATSHPGAVTWGDGMGTLDMLSDRDLSATEDFIASATSAGKVHRAKYVQTSIDN